MTIQLQDIRNFVDNAKSFKEIKPMIEYELGFDDNLISLKITAQMNTHIETYSAYLNVRINKRDFGRFELTGEINAQVFELFKTLYDRSFDYKYQEIEHATQAGENLVMSLRNS